MEMLCRELSVKSAILSQWKEKSLAEGAAAMKGTLDERDGEITMAKFLGGADTKTL